MSKIASIIKEMREKADMTQAVLAEKLGYSSPQFISNVERGICKFPLERIKDFIKHTKGDAAKIRQAYADDYSTSIGKFFTNGKAKK